ncbi:MAG: 30S ribosomal protein S20 [Ruminococcus sp.]|jgi:small subunit ribosomal protein S20|nr:30S ribosomal protein S20 [Ruminococcus sp.]
MANIKSAQKRVKVAAKKNLRNKAVKTALKTTLKKADLALSAKTETTESTIRVAIKKIDQAAAKGILHKNNAARKKSALQKKLNALG